MRSSRAEDANGVDSLKDHVSPMKNGQTPMLRRLSARKYALGAKIKAIWTDRRGVAAVEFGLFAIILSVGLANVTDVSIYIYQRMQVENATEIAAQAAWKACDLSKLPATTNCPGLATAMLPSGGKTGQAVLVPATTANPTPSRTTSIAAAVAARAWDILVGG